MKTKNEFKQLAEQITSIVRNWENSFITLSPDHILTPRNIQNRNVKQILGHLIDSASNNHQRLVRLQYTEILDFPDYRPQNDIWIAVQHYEEAHWINMIQLWKFYNFHISHIIENVDIKCLQHTWANCDGKIVTLESMITGYYDHLLLHLKEIEELIK